MKKFDLYERDNIDWSGNSIFEPSGPIFPRSPNLEMMGQDAGATIFGQCHERHGRGGRRFSSVSFRFEPDDRIVIDYFRTLVGGQSRDLDYHIAEFINMISRTIIVEDRFVYELQIGRDKKTQGVVEMNFSPVSAPHDKLLVCGRHVVQLLPSSVSRKYACSRFCHLDPADTFIFRAPSRWSHILKNARSALSFFDAMRHRLTDQLVESMNKGRQTLHDYDHSSNLKMLAKATVPLGWSGRGLFHGYETDYHGVERQIRWNTFCIDLRNHIIRGLEAAVHRIADIVNSSCRLIVDETREYTLEDVRKKLQEGKTSTVELVKLLF